MSELLIELLKQFETVDIHFCLSKSNLKLNFFGTLSRGFDNDWGVSVVDDDGEFSVLIYKGEYEFYHNFKKDDSKDVAKLILEVMNYEKD